MLFSKKYLESTRERTILIRTDEAREYVKELVKQLQYGPLIEWRSESKEIENRIMAVISEIVRETVG